MKYIIVMINNALIIIIILFMSSSLSYLTVTTHTHSRPQLVAMDDVIFLHPVDIGSIVNFKATLLYTHIQRRIVTVSVEAQVIHAETGTRKTTNTFFFHFQCKPPVATTDSSNTEASKQTDFFPFVIPTLYSDALRWLDARRRVNSLLESE